MICYKCKLDLIKNEDKFGDLTYDIKFICKDCMINNNNWYCYILRSLNEKYKNYTYIGKTNNPQKRLRQHNCEIKGGAKYTKKIKPCEIYCLISGFESNVEALQAEWRLKHPTGTKYSGEDGRIKNLINVLNDNKFTKKSKRLIKDMNLTIWIVEEYLKLLNDKLENVNLIVKR
jgi:predicted GIY-YIG superfamily endonuclease